MTKIDKRLYEEIGFIIKKKRNELNMSLDLLSRMIGFRKTKSTLKRYEDGVSRIDMDTLEKICGVLGLDYNDVISTAMFIVENTDNATDDDFANALEQKGLNDISTIEEATLFLIQNPVVAAYGGYDLDKMTDEEKIEFANQIADSIKFFGNKYK